MFIINMMLSMLWVRHIGTGLDNTGGMPPEVSGSKKHRLPGLRGTCPIDLTQSGVLCVWKDES